MDHTLNCIERLYVCMHSSNHAFTILTSLCKCLVWAHMCNVHTNVYVTVSFCAANVWKCCLCDWETKVEGAERKYQHCQLHLVQSPCDEFSTVAAGAITPLFAGRTRWPLVWEFMGLKVRLWSRCVLYGLHTSCVHDCTCIRVNHDKDIYKRKCNIS